MKYQVLFPLKNNEKVFMNVICCSCDWRFKGYGVSGNFYPILSNVPPVYYLYSCHK